MSTTALTWAVMAAVLATMSPVRPAWAVALYMMTFFAAPQLWWWGDELPVFRYQFWAGVVLLVAVVLYLTRATEDVGRRFTWVHRSAILMIVNATFVHLVFAADPVTSGPQLVEFAKFVLLFFLIWGAIQDRRDYRLVLMAIAVGCLYIGYEVTINERGDFNGSRLEGVGAPGAESSNSLADVMLVSLPLIGSLFVNGKMREKAVAIVSASLALNVLLLCNSRGAFLGLIGAGFTFLLIARGATRKKAIRALALGGVALFLLLGDPEILDRFSTTFVGSEERDTSAASRIEFWRAGFRMLSDHPLGAGGNAFKFVYGGGYITEVTGDTAEGRSLHNGYLSEATDWGVQGLALKLLFFGAAILAAFRASARCTREGRIEDALMGICVLVAGLGFLIHCMFGSFLANEWAYWIVALLVRYHDLYMVADSSAGAAAVDGEAAGAARAAA